MKISKHTESKLLQALEKTAVLVNSGTDPSEAIAKVAQEDGIPPGNINLMVHAYNTGRTTRQRVDGSDPMDKSADFLLADASTVLDRMYPDNVKTAAQEQRSTAVSTEYAIPPTGILQRREKRAVRSRTVDWGMVDEPPEAYPEDPMTRMRKAYNESERLQRKATEARIKVSQAREKMAATFMELSNYFRRPEATPIPVVTEQVSILHGGKGQQVMDQLVKVTPGLMKLSQHKSAVRKPGLTAADGEPYALVSQLLDEVEAYKAAKAEHEGVYKDAAERSEALLHPFVQPRIQSVLEEPSLSKEAISVLPPLMAGSLLTNIFRKPRETVSGTFQSAAGGMKPIKKDVQDVYEDLSDPLHDQQLRAIRAQAMLQDLMINDPVISGYEPEETTEAFNELTQIAPRAADKRILMQGLLRKRLAQGLLDPYEVEQMLNTEQQQHKLTAPPVDLKSG